MRRIIENPLVGREIGASARAVVQRSYGWNRAAERFEFAYGRALAFKFLPS
jgi:hypothetical protein